MSRRVAAKSAGGVEYRAIPLGDTGVTDDGSLNGLAVRFDSQTQIGDPEWGFRESFTPGAFTKTLAESDLVLLDNHDTGRPIARKSAGTLQARQADGLRWDAAPTSKASYINDVRENIKAKNYGGCSFGFQPVKEDWLDDDGNPSDPWNGTQRVVREAKLFEISVCTFPAYTDTEVNSRDAVSALREYRAGGPPVEDSVESAAVSTDTRDDPDGMEYAAIDSAADLLRAGNADEALRVLEENQASRSAVIPKPEDSTSEPFDLRIYKFRLESSRPKDGE